MLPFTDPRATGQRSFPACKTNLASRYSKVQDISNSKIFILLYLLLEHFVCTDTINLKFIGQLCLSLKLGTSRNPCVYGTNSPGIAICWEPYVLSYRGYRTYATSWTRNCVSSPHPALITFLRCDICVCVCVCKWRVCLMLEVPIIIHTITFRNQHFDFSMHCLAEQLSE